MRVPPEKADPDRMRSMFGAIAPRYDFVTRAFSYGLDRAWKREALEGAQLPENACVLDLACGTGDFSKLVVKALPGASVVAADLTHSMVRLARGNGIQSAICADAMRLPFPDRHFHAVFVGYGLRNFPNLATSLHEIGRVLRPGGLLVSLDFFLPADPLFRRCYLAYLFLQGACWGLLLHGRPRTYTYIPDSLRGFVSAGELSALLERIGYSGIRERQHLWGGIALHWAHNR
jgi:demethylmenaquinone methyltransferase / 2-methoxy-6-polyprenyl-1,4-benzoquinol methylase